MVQISKGMSQDMYDFILDNFYRIPDINIDTGVITTPKGTNGTICTSTGYLRAKLNKKTIQVHQLLAVLYYGEDCIGKQVNHLDGNKVNNKKENLELCTQYENITHAIGTGLYEGSMSALREASMSKRKLTDDNVRFIRDNYDKAIGDNSRLSARKLGKMMGVNHRAILDVAYSISYQDVK